MKIMICKKKVNNLYLDEKCVDSDFENYDCQKKVFAPNWHGNISAGHNGELRSGLCRFWLLSLLALSHTKCGLLIYSLNDKQRQNLIKL